MKAPRRLIAITRSHVASDVSRNGRRSTDARVGDEDVEATGVPHDAVDDGFDCRTVRGVELDGLGAPAARRACAQVVGRGASGRDVAIGDVDRRAVTHETGGDATSDPLAAPVTIATCPASGAP